MTQLPIYTPTDQAGPASSMSNGLSAGGVSDQELLKDFGTGDHIKDTKSLCPVCLDKIDASVFERDGAVYMDKECAHHGRYSAGQRRHTPRPIAHRCPVLRAVRAVGGRDRLNRWPSP